MQAPKPIAALLLLIGIFGCTTTKQLRAKAPKHLKLEVFGGYHPQEVGLGMRKVYPEMKICHLSNGSPAGRMVVQYTIVSVDGSVKESSVLSDVDTIKNPGLDSCIAGAIARLKYDKLNAGNDSKVIYPLIFPLQ